MVVDTSLLPGGMRPDASATLAPLPQSRLKKILKALAYVAIFFAALILFILLKLPDSLISNSVLNALNNNTPYRWQAEKINARFFLLPHLSTEKLTMEGKGFGSTMPPITFDTMKVYPSLLSLIPITGAFKPRVSFDGSAYQASLQGSAKLGNDLSVNFVGENVNLAKLTPLRDMGVDLQGVFTNLTTQLDADGGDLSRANGSVEIQGKGLVVDPAALPIPMSLPILDLGPADIKAKITQGRVDLERFQLGGAGKDLDLRVSGDIRLSKNPAFSPANLRVLLKFSPKVFQAMPSLKGLLDTLATPQPDGSYAMRFSGTLANLGMPRPDK